MASVALQRRRRRAGLALVTAAALGVVTSLAGIAVGWRLTGQFEETIDDSLVLTEDALITIDDTIELADDVIASIADTLTVVEDAVAASSGSFAAADRVLVDLVELTDVAGPSLVDAAVTVDELAATGSVVDAFLEGVAGLPLTPSYSGDLGGRLDELADQLAPLGETLQAAGGDLDDLRDGAGELEEDLAELRASIATVNSDLAGTEALLDDYRTRASEASALAGATRDDLDGETRLTRWFIVAAGIVFAFGQIVPAWLGVELLGESRTVGSVRFDEDANG